MSPAVQAAHADEFRHLKAAKGTIQFAPTDRVPPTVVRAIVAERKAELDRRRPGATDRLRRRATTRSVSARRRGPSGAVDLTNLD
jgi:hypothetical protein